MYVIEFAPPMSGIEGEFNTFRLGLKWSKVLIPNDIVLLVDKAQSRVIGRSVVTAVHRGKLQEMAEQWAHLNHNQKGLDPVGAPERLIANMIKRYGPHKCCHTSSVSVIALRRFE